MEYFHVRLSVKGNRHDETKLDMDQESLERIFLIPYRNGDPITVNGRTIPQTDIERIRISVSKEPGDVILLRLQQENASSRAMVIGGPSMPWRVAAKAEDVTDQFITGPPGSSENAHAATRMDTEIHTPLGPGDRRSLFLVAGRDGSAISGVLTFVRALGIRVVEWDHAVARTGVPNPYVGDVILTGMRMADAILVLLTPDDMVVLRDDLVRDDDGETERCLLGQARPNVFYEAGMADILGRERTVIVEVGKIKPFSDVAGRHVVKFDGSPTKRKTLAERLKIAGLEPDMSGSDWLTAGDIGAAVDAAKTMTDEHGARYKVLE
ncbi:TIR domain-containing protein [Actinoplanes sp. NPDC051861]|uniref:TIR domain-containing protein n=1 Tax=Actinoplanes sp. NPDC051861 TaxID=3155170 RepID=UPI00342EA38A